MPFFSFKKFKNSVFHAARGFRCALGEQNFKIQILISIVVIFFALYFRLKGWEIIALTMMIVLILVLEIINSIFERIIDILEPRVHPYAKIVKDMMASAVLISSLGAIFVGLTIFWPYLERIIFQH